MKRNNKKVIRYAVVGIGHIAQVAMIPAFRHAQENSSLVAFVTGDIKKSQKVANEHHPVTICGYDEYEALLASGAIDAVYIALPNHMHYEYTAMALKAGIHVLCEKPFTLEAKQSERLIQLSEKYGAKLMVAYRLHFDPANLKVVEYIKDRKLGELKYFTSSFSFKIENSENIRLQKNTGGGPIWDIGIYCINAARMMFREEPTEVFAFAGGQGMTKLFAEVPEAMTVSMRFSKDRFATFTCSFNTEAISMFDLVGTKGRVRLEGAYEYAGKRELSLIVDEKETKKTFPKMDQFAPELLYFSECILKNKKPEPSGLEGLADVRIIEAILRSAEQKKAVSLREKPMLEKKKKIDPKQAKRKPSITSPKTHGVQAPH
ncbi:Gfo/Idh/MocA family protein [Pseudobdellovibrio exovorus]|uniref:Gfo/Idh/MocA family oxidoreductase n=1 Tax=Pseudobdellovibrio exovorus JSS TaxID=1184267 RepID=M4V8Y1_9BACT|nr:Gfo/Idh/MocA family oxidoreductase [Pseudobdellovibrio exovorus]AGH94466.1 hypothetical protein A11Q_246 [Pseudobdellovibrio exovorus JSS]